jgi:hypothetical protein
MSNRYSSDKKPHLIYFPFVLLFIGIYVIYLISVTPSASEMIPIIPGPAITDAIILLILLPIVGYILLIFTPYIAMGYYNIYRRIFGKSRLYFLDMKVQLGRLTIKDVAKRSLTPGLLICAFSQAIVDSTGIDMWVVESNPTSLLLALFNAAFFAYLLVIILIAPLWLLYDAGVVSRTNPEKILQRRIPETVETIHKFYISKYRGFGGIAFLVSFISLIVQTILRTVSPLVLFFVILVPFLGIALIIPVQALYERYLPTMTKKIHMSTMLHKSELTLIKSEDCPACSQITKK